MAGEVRLSLVTNVTVAGLLFDSLRFYRARWACIGFPQARDGSYSTPVKSRITMIDGGTPAWKYKQSLCSFSRWD